MNREIAGELSSILRALSRFGVMKDASNASIFCQLQDASRLVVSKFEFELKSRTFRQLPHT